MKKAAIFGSIGVVALFAIIYFLMGVSYKNAEKRLRNAIVNKQNINVAELDTVKKTIAQSVEVTDMQKDALVEIIVGNAKARKGGSGTLATLVTEAVPNVDTGVYKQLMNIIAGARDTFLTRQKELQDLKREHDNCIDTFPSSFFVGDKSKIDIVIVTSTVAKEAFKTGVDDDVKLKK